MVYQKIRQFWILSILSYQPNQKKSDDRKETDQLLSIYDCKLTMGQKRCSFLIIF